MKYNLNEEENYRQLEIEKNTKDLASLYNQGSYIPTGEVGLDMILDPLEDVENLSPEDIIRIRNLKAAQLDALIKKEEFKKDLSSEQFTELMEICICTCCLLGYDSDEVRKHIEKNGENDYIRDVFGRMDEQVLSGLLQEKTILENIEYNTIDLKEKLINKTDLLKDIVKEIRVDNSEYNYETTKGNLEFLKNEDNKFGKPIGMNKDKINRNKNKPFVNFGEKYPELVY